MAREAPELRVAGADGLGGQPAQGHAAGEPRKACDPGAGPARRGALSPERPRVRCGRRASPGWRGNNSARAGGVRAPRARPSARPCGAAALRLVAERALPGPAALRPAGDADGRTSPPVRRAPGAPPPRPPRPRASRRRPSSARPGRSQRGCSAHDRAPPRGGRTARATAGLTSGLGGASPAGAGATPSSAGPPGCGIHRNQAGRAGRAGPSEGRGQARGRG